MLNFLKKYFASLYIPLAWTIIVGTLCFLPGSMLPDEAHFEIPQFDKFVHITFFGGFVFLWNLYEAKRVNEPKRLLRLFFLWYVIGNIYGIGTISRGCPLGVKGSRNSLPQRFSDAHSRFNARPKRAGIIAPNALNVSSLRAHPLSLIEAI